MTICGSFFIYLFISSVLLNIFAARWLNNFPAMFLKQIGYICSYKYIVFRSIELYYGVNSFLGRDRTGKSVLFFREGGFAPSLHYIKPNDYSQVYRLISDYILLTLISDHFTVYLRRK